MLAGRIREGIGAQLPQSAIALSLRSAGQKEEGHDGRKSHDVEQRAWTPCSVGVGSLHGRASHRSLGGQLHGRLGLGTPRVGGGVSSRFSGGSVNGCVNEVRHPVGLVHGVSGRPGRW